MDSTHNPADDASRGLTTTQLIESTRWLHGPYFLYGDNIHWPSRPGDTDVSQIPECEIRKESHIYAVTSDKVDVINRLFDRCSSWMTLKICIAWLLRFKNILLRKIRKIDDVSQQQQVVGSLGVEELKQSEFEIVKYIQRQSFSDDVKTLANTCSVKKSSP